MQQYVKDRGIKFNRPKRMLVSCMKCEQTLFSTRLLKWYMSHGLVVQNITDVIEFCSAPVFRKFVNLVADYRRMAAADDSKAELAHLYKILLVSSYGSMYINRERHTRVKIAGNRRQASIAVNERSFKNLHYLGKDLYEVEIATSKVRHDLPLVVAFNILQNAKVRMLEVYYDFLNVYIMRDMCTLCTMDTDSLYVSLSRETLEECVHPHLKDEYISRQKGSCGQPRTAQDLMLARTCCAACEFTDSRTCGIFKFENVSDAIYALAPKSYVTINYETQAVKLSAKGCRRRPLLQQRPVDIFKAVLDTGDPHHVINRGIRLLDGKVVTYRLLKPGISFQYFKRIVLPTLGGIYTRPLDIVARPVPRNYIIIQIDCPQLAPDHVLEFTLIGNVTVRTIRQAYVFNMARVIKPLDRKLHESILATSDTLQLVKYEQSLHLTSEWIATRENVIEAIVHRRMSQHTHYLSPVVRAQDQPPFANACQYDVFLGMGVTPDELKWRPNFDGGRNILGLLYDKVRTSLS